MSDLFIYLFFKTGSEIDCGFQSVVTRHMPHVLSSNTRFNHAPPIANAIQMIEFDILNPVVLWQFTSFTVVFVVQVVTAGWQFSFIISITW